MLMEDEPEITVIEGLCLTMDVQWPVSILFHQKAMLQYQILFRRLLQLHHLQRLLGR